MRPQFSAEPNDDVQFDYFGEQNLSNKKVDHPRQHQESRLKTFSEVRICISSMLPAVLGI